MKTYLFSTFHQNANQHSMRGSNPVGNAILALMSSLKKSINKANIDYHAIYSAGSGRSCESQSIMLTRAKLENAKSEFTSSLQEQITAVDEELISKCTAFINAAKLLVRPEDEKLLSNDTQSILYFSIVAADLYLIHLNAWVNGTPSVSLPKDT